jgi:hypothetical protein
VRQGHRKERKSDRKTNTLSPSRSLLVSLSLPPSLPLLFLSLIYLLNSKQGAVSRFFKAPSIYIHASEKKKIGVAHLTKVSSSSKAETLGEQHVVKQ